MELIILLLFSALLIVCLLLDISILWALAAGYFLFAFYALKKGFSVKEIGKMSWDGIVTVKNILLTFIFIGMLTASWRASGTVASVVCYSVRLITPSIFVLMAFLLCCLISFLMGSSFASVATMGSVCMTIGLAMKVSPVLTGGAILSGIYFGDRCSPVSTSALLTAELTHTTVFDNIKGMVKTAFVPFIISCVFYFALSLHSAGSGEITDVNALFSQVFQLGFLPLIPAIVILVLSLCRVPVRAAMLFSILTAVSLCIFYQKLPVTQTLLLLIAGYTSGVPEVDTMMSGGGIVSMIRVGAIVCLSSSFSGIFQKTGLLNGLKAALQRFSGKVCPFAVILLTSTVACLVSCNQTLAIILTYQLCEDVQPDNKKFAIDLENSAVVIAALVPWCIACAVPLATVNAPTSAILFAVYLFLLPLWQLLTDLFRQRKLKSIPPHA